MRAFMVVLAIALFPACPTSSPADSGPTWAYPEGDAGQPGPLPSLDAISPSTAEVGATPPTLVITGRDFVTGCAVLWDGVARSVTRDSATSLRLVLVADDLSVPRTHEVVVVNPAGGASAPKTFTVLGPAPEPRVDALSPAAARAGSPSLTVRVAGGNFAPASVVRVGGQDRATTFLSSVLLEATLLDTDLAVAGPLEVKVFTPAPGGGTSNAATFTVEATSGALWRASLADDGGELLTAVGRDFSLSADGRFVLFTSGSDQVTAGDTNGFVDVFLRDTCAGASAGCVPSTRRVSLGADGGQLGADSVAYGVSRGGRYVLFRTKAPQVLEGLAPNQFTFVLRDTCVGAAVGCMPQNLPVVRRLDGGVGSTTEPFDATLTADARFVSFLHDGDDLVPGDTNARTDAFQLDTCLGAPAGCVVNTARVSLAEDGGDGSRGPNGPPMSSADGRFVVFVSGANDLVGNDTSSGGDTFLRDTCRGASGCQPTTLKVSFGPRGEEAGFRTCNGPSMSSDGRHVSFQCSNALGFVDTNNDYDLYLRDTCAGATGCSPTTLLVSQGLDGGAASRGSNAAGPTIVSSTGRYVAFFSEATDLVVDDPTLRDAFVRDTCLGAPAGCVPSTRLVSRAPGAGVPNAGISWDGPALSADGRYLLFRSAASDLVANDGNGVEDLFLVRTGF